MTHRPPMLILDDLGESPVSEIQTDDDVMNSLQQFSELRRKNMRQAYLALRQMGRDVRTAYTEVLVAAFK